MTREPATRVQVSGHRFLARRIEHALVRGDTRMLDDPLAAQSISLVIGAVLAVAALAGCAGLAYLKPAGVLGDAPVVVARENGATYVRIGDRLHPVFNLASARLIAGAATEPRIVAQRAVDEIPRGPLVGIPGAPHHIPVLLPGQQSQWTVCDDTRSQTTTVIAGPIADGPVRAGRTALVVERGDNAAATYLLYEGRRARVDLRHPAVVRALKLDGATPQPVAPALLAAIPEAPAIVPPHVPAGPSALPDLPAGTVLQVPGDADAELFVVLADGVQRVGEVAADLIRYTDARAGGSIPQVTADRIGALPVIDTLPVTTYPQRTGVRTDPVVCAHWEPTAGTHTTVLTGAELPVEQPPVILAQSDGAGPALDAVSMPAGRGAFIRSVGLTGSGPRSGPMFLVSDAGVRFGVADTDAASALGLVEPPVPAPWPVLAALPAGPELSRGAASVSRDGLGASP